MAPLEVYTCCSYPARRGRRTPAQWAAVQFVRALKGQPIAGISIVPLPDGTHGLLDVTTAEQSVGWFGRMAAAAAPWEECGRVALVPLPNSWCDITCRQPSRTVMLAGRRRAMSSAPGRNRMRRAALGCTDGSRPRGWRNAGSAGALQRPSPPGSPVIRSKAQLRDRRRRARHGCPRPRRRCFSDGLRRPGALRDLRRARRARPPGQSVSQST